MRPSEKFDQLDSLELDVHSAIANFKFLSKEFEDKGLTVESGNIITEANKYVDILGQISGDSGKKAKLEKNKLLKKLKSALVELSALLEGETRASLNPQNNDEIESFNTTQSAIEDNKLEEPSSSEIENEAKNIDEALEAASVSIEALYDRFLKHFGEAAVPTSLEEAFDIIVKAIGADDTEIDKNTAKLKKGIYLKKLKKIIKKVEGEFAEMVKQRKNEKENYIPANLPVATESSKQTEKDLVIDEMSGNLNKETPTTEQESNMGDLEKQITACESFNELYETLDSLDDLMGSANIFYSSDELKTNIEKIRSDAEKTIRENPDKDKALLLGIVFRLGVSGVTRTAGLKKHVINLLKQEFYSDNISEPDEALEQKNPDSLPVADEVEVTSPKNYEVSQEYKDWRENLISAKRAYSETESKYNLALQKYYHNSVISDLRRIGSGVKDLFGLKTKLSPELDNLKKELILHRQQYAESLSAVLQARGLKNFDQESEKTKIHFVEKFIIKPNKKLLEYQENSQSQENRSITANILERFAGGFDKNKQLIRYGAMTIGITAAGVAAAAIAPTAAVGAFIGGASFKASKIFASLYLGAEVGVKTHKAMGKFVTKAENEFGNTEKKIKSDFSLDNLSRDAEIYEKTKKDIRVAQKRQTAATVFSGVAVGGATYGLGNVLESQFSGPEVSEKITWETDTDFEAETNMIETQLTLPGVQVTLDNSSFGESNYLISSEIGFNGSELPEDAKGQLDDLIKKEVTKAHIDNHHFNIDRLEGVLPGELERKFGKMDWWPEGGIVVDLEAREVSNQLENNATEIPPVQTDLPESEVEPEPKVETEPAPEAVSDPENADIHVVEERETLSGIVNDRFKTQLDQLPKEDYNKVLYELLGRVKESPDLQESLGLQSKNIDLIKIGERLNLSSLDAEFADIISENSRVETTVVEAVESPKVVENKFYTGDIALTSEAALEVNDSKGQASVEAVPAAVEDEARYTETNYEVERLTPPVGNFPTTGQYLNDPAYVEYRQQIFPDEKSFLKAVDQSVKIIDNSTSGFLDRFFGESYKSPYEVMSSMTLSELEELEEAPRDLARGFCEQNNLKYESYRNWQDQIQEMKDLPHQDSTTLKDLFSRQVVQNAAENYDPLNRTITT